MYHVSFSFDIGDAEDLNHAAMLGWDQLTLAVLNGRARASIEDSSGHQRKIEIEVLTDTALKTTPI